MPSIHFRIQALRKAKGWTQEQLAAEVSRLEGLAKPLSWQTVQHWEREDGTAPKRKRLEFVALALGATVETLVSDDPRPSSADTIGVLVAAEPAPTPWVQLPQAVEQVVSAVAALSPSAWAMVRGALDSVVGHPEMRDDVAGNVLLVLQAKPGKRRLAA